MFFFFVAGLFTSPQPLRVCCVLFSTLFCFCFELWSLRALHAFSHELCHFISFFFYFHSLAMSISLSPIFTMAPPSSSPYPHGCVGWTGNRCFPSKIVSNTHFSAPAFVSLSLQLSLFCELQRSLVNCSPCSWWYFSFPLRCVAGVCLFVLAYVAEVFYGVVPPYGSYYRVVFCGLGWLCDPCVRIISDVSGRGKTT